MYVELTFISKFNNRSVLGLWKFGDVSEIGNMPQELDSRLCELYATTSNYSLTDGPENLVRGRLLKVFCSWISHTDALSSKNVEGAQYIRIELNSTFIWSYL